MPKLSNDVNLKFVQLYRQEECLWNACIPSYKSMSMRDLSLQKMYVDLIGIKMTVNEVKNKIKHLRATYCQMLSKIEKSIRSGACAKA